jgi:hypothetical protein
MKFRALLKAMFTTWVCNFCPLLLINVVNYSTKLHQHAHVYCLNKFIEIPKGYKSRQSTDGLLKIP